MKTFLISLCIFCVGIICYLTGVWVGYQMREIDEDEE